METEKDTERDQAPLPAGLNRWILNNILSKIEELEKKIDAMSQSNINQKGR
jgi:hypothetical protein